MINNFDSPSTLFIKRHTPKLLDSKLFSLFNTDPQVN